MYLPSIKADLEYLLWFCALEHNKVRHTGFTGFHQLAARMEGVLAEIYQIELRS